MRRVQISKKLEKYVLQKPSGSNLWGLDSFFIIPKLKKIYR